MRCEQTQSVNPRFRAIFVASFTFCQTSGTESLDASDAEPLIYSRAPQTASKLAR